MRLTFPDRLVSISACSVSAPPQPEANARSQERKQRPEGAEPFHSGEMAQDETYTRTFNLPGRYVCFCLPHETDGMVATLVVKPLEKDGAESE